MIRPCNLQPQFWRFSDWATGSSEAKGRSVHLNNWSCEHVDQSVNLNGTTNIVKYNDICAEGNYWFPWLMAQTQIRGLEYGKRNLTSFGISIVIWYPHPSVCAPQAVCLSTVAPCLLEHGKNVKWNEVVLLMDLRSYCLRIFLECVEGHFPHCCESTKMGRNTLTFVPWFLAVVNLLTNRITDISLLRFTLFSMSVL